MATTQKPRGSLRLHPSTKLNDDNGQLTFLAVCQRYHQTEKVLQIDLGLGGGTVEKWLRRGYSLIQIPNQFFSAALRALASDDPSARGDPLIHYRAWWRGAEKKQPQKSRSELFDEIRALARRGFSQRIIAHRLSTNQTLIGRCLKHSG